jgi:hypothetical protein
VHPSRVPLPPASRRRNPWRVWCRMDASFLPIPFFLGQSRHRVCVIPAQAGIHTGGSWIPAEVYPRTGGGGYDKRKKDVYSF